MAEYGISTPGSAIGEILAGIAQGVGGTYNKILLNQAIVNQRSKAAALQDLIKAAVTSGDPDSVEALQRGDLMEAARLTKQRQQQGLQDFMTQAGQLSQPGGAPA